MRKFCFEAKKGDHGYLVTVLKVYSNGKEEKMECRAYDGDGLNFKADHRKSFLHMPALTLQ